MRGRIPDALSASRIILALLVVVASAQLDAWRYIATVAMVLLALITDVLDGYLARRWHTTTAAGYVLDSLGDRAMHLALVLVFLVRYSFHPLFAWLLIFRDIGIFAVRVLSTGWLQKSIGLQWISRLQASGLRIWLGMFILRDGFRVFTHADVLGTYTFEVVQFTLLCSTVLASYYGLFRSVTGLVHHDHDSA